MDRTPCNDLPAFPLQLLLRREPEWRQHPAAVVAEDRPQGKILWVNEKARVCGVLPGMRYAAAQALLPALRAGVVPPAEIVAAVAEGCVRLRQFTPFVEPAEGEPGVFWLDARGLIPLWGSLDAWAAQVHTDAVRAGFVASLVVGFSRIRCVCHRRPSERPACRVVPNCRLSFLQWRPRAGPLFRMEVFPAGGLDRARLLQRRARVSAIQD